MSRSIILVPITSNTGLQTVITGLLKAMHDEKISATLVPELSHSEISHYLLQNNLNKLLEHLVGLQEQAAENHQITITKGITLNEETPFAMELNYKMAVALNAAIIFVGSAHELPAEQFLQRLQIIATPYLSTYAHEIIGLIINKTPENFPDLSQYIDKYSIFKNIDLKLIATIPYTPELNLAKVFDTNWLKLFLSERFTTRLTPEMFCYNLMTKAKAAQKRIILPEGDEPRTIAAANICAEEDLAKCILVGEKSVILQTAEQAGIKLNDKIIILEPANIREKYVEPLYELRKAKGLTKEQALEQLQDNVMLGTMMLKLDEVDGLVSGAVHTTANTIRPALQIIKTVPDTDIVSSVFFMCFPTQVLAYADCAINLKPTAPQLADIAIQTADSAMAMGISPRVAMLSYSTGSSGKGPEVENVREAVSIAKNKRPELSIEGPIQYDAAIIKDVAALKMPNSEVAGKATVLIFPDLNAGNIAAKVAQRSANIICIGPTLQGLQKPVNDLSRGCLVEDIVFTIALTAVQAAQK